MVLSALNKLQNKVIITPAYFNGEKQLVFWLTELCSQDTSPFVSWMSLAHQIVN